jgi:hypothetical protein
MTDRFNPITGADYGVCLNCHELLPDRHAANTHMDETLKASPDSRSHSIRASNRNRAERIESHILSLVQDALDGAVSEIEDLIANGDISEEEATNASDVAYDLADAWADRD